MHLLRPLSRRLLTLSRPTPFQLPKSHLARQPILLPLYKFQEPVLFSTIRWASSITTTPTLSPDGLQNNRDHSPSPSPTISESDTSLLSSLPPSPPGREDVPSYAMVFTCKKCDARSAHRVSKQGYHHGTVLITCPSCKNKHLMADHLKIFSDERVTVEDILREKGGSFNRAVVGAEGDVEFLPKDDVEAKG